MATRTLKTSNGSLRATRRRIFHACIEHLAECSFKIGLQLISKIYIVETAWIDIDYMDTWKDFTMDPENFPQDKMIALSKRLHANKQKFVTMVDPALSTNTTYKTYQIGHEMDVFMKNNDGTEFIGQVWPGYTVFPGIIITLQIQRIAI